mmetsp:Transcript_162/g.313  ORF Transcript_162/g.313 Transcript_162/m.313 type:complete len:532 (+) Transcript_162:126-1721(+)|eukprot:CAMPEP_0184650666 /NCGR_PEP_ID=MMETSP0308-20130426/8230_1 /TAXON_ID=38269 /ORGANISM="Gloeochaete witrockiana, Strain SAG 46.84" /LENGTH=531 /DNA_ID=CAMNT_0027084369 /DNA_START=89 /DNA_END=1684 /DNA_ORIENTATION=-
MWALDQDIKIYNISQGSSVPQWIADKRKRKRTDDGKRSIELIQDLEFPTASQNIQVTPDCQYLVATGTYPPQIRVFDLSQLSLKFQRNLTCEVVRFQVLSDDYSKIVLLNEDRCIDFHAQFGSYYKTRIPKCGRDLAYDPGSCNLYIGGSSQEVYRLNLSIGTFLEPLQTSSDAVNTCSFNDVHRLLCFGCENGTVECWDPRSNARAFSLDMQDTTAELTGDNWDGTSKGAMEVSATKFDCDGLTLGVGVSAGYSALFDIRSRHPLIVKDHHHGLPIHSIHFHSAGQVISADTKIARVWERVNGKVVTAIQADGDIADICLIPMQGRTSMPPHVPQTASGLLMMAGEQPRVQCYFIPALGPAPKWCSFLENITEELEEEKKQAVYDDYKFVTRSELQQLGLLHLVGTSMLRAYMHGFFLDMRLYKKAVSITQPFLYEEYRKKRIAEKIAKDRDSRIVPKKRLPKVNAKLASDLVVAASNADKSSKSAKRALSSSILDDARFKSLFENPDFEVDPESFDYSRQKSKAHPKQV